MITQVKAEGFKGQTFVQDLDESTLLIGPNGAGKSARTQALTLALLGYIPGSGKTNAEILDTFGSGDELTVGVTVGNKIFERGYFRTKAGVSQGFKFNGKKVSKDVFTSFLAKSGGPTAIDIGVFMGLSDQKKIDFIFDLYPSEQDLSKLIFEIEKTREGINALTQKAKSTEDAAARLAASRASMQLPTGTMAELQAQEKLLDQQLSNAREELEQARIAEARKTEAAKARNEMLLAVGYQYPMDDLGEMSDPAWLSLYTPHKEAWDKKQKDAFLEELRDQKETRGRVLGDAPQNQGKDTPQHAGSHLRPAPAGMPGPSGAAISGTQDSQPRTFSAGRVEESIQAILDALNAAGCSACAARLVALRELQKYRRKVA